MLLSRVSISLAAGALGTVAHGLQGQPDIVAPISLSSGIVCTLADATDLTCENIDSSANQTAEFLCIRFHSIQRSVDPATYTAGAIAGGAGGLATSVGDLVASVALDTSQSPPTATESVGYVEESSGNQLLVSAQAVPDTTVQVAIGGTTVSHIGRRFKISAAPILTGFVFPPAGAPGNTTSYIVVVDAVGALAVRAGTDGNPGADPSLSEGDVVLARVTLTVGDVAIGAANIADLRSRAGLYGVKALPNFLAATTQGRALMAPGFFNHDAIHPGSASCKFGAGAFPARNVGAAETNALLFVEGAGEPAPGRTVIIGTTVYEFRADSPPTGGTAGRVWVWNGDIGGGAVAATARTNLRNAIRAEAVRYPAGDAAVVYNGVVPQNFWASVVGNYVSIYSCAVLGAANPGASEAGVVCNDTLATVGDDWANGSPGPCGGGRAETHTHWASATAPGLTAAKIASGALVFVFPFAPMGCAVINRMRPQNEAYIVSGYNVQLTLAGGVTPNNQPNDVIDCIAWGG